MTVSLATVGVPPDVAAIIQDRTLERLFNEALFPAQLYRLEAVPSLWPVNLGERMVFTRTGLLPVNTKPSIPGTDPTPKTYPIEQWEAEAAQYFDTIDTHMPTSYVSLASQFIKNVQTLGLNAGQTINRVSRNRLFRAYLGGNTVSNVLGVISSTSLHVASLNGFTEKLFGGRPAPVSSANPLAITFPGTAEPANTVVGYSPDDPNEPAGPGTLVLGVGLTTALAARSPVLADTRSRITRVGGGTSVDSLTGANILTAQTIIDTVAALRNANVPACPDGTFHVHLTPIAEAQLFADNQFQRIFQSIPSAPENMDASIGQGFGCKFYRNTESPSQDNTGTLVASGVVGGTNNALESPELGGEVVNNAGLPVQRTIVIGGGALYEKYLDESQFMTEAGVTGKVGAFQVTNNGVIINTQRIRLVLRAPLDRAQQVVSSTWTWSGDFPVPSDMLVGSTARYKRARVIEHA